MTSTPYTIVVQNFIFWWWCHHFNPLSYCDVNSTTSTTALNLSSIPTFQSSTYAGLLTRCLIKIRGFTWTEALERDVKDRKWTLLMANHLQSTPCGFAFYTFFAPSSTSGNWIMVTILNGNNDTYFFTSRCLTGNSSFIDRWILKRENYDAYQIYQGLL